MTYLACTVLTRWTRKKPSPAAFPQLHSISDNIDDVDSNYSLRLEKEVRLSPAGKSNTKWAKGQIGEGKTGKIGLVSISSTR